MTSRFAILTIDALEPAVVAGFWCEVLGWVVIEESVDGVSIGPADAGGPTMDVVPVPERKTVKNRLHLDVRADGSTNADELYRLLELGAKRVDVGQPADAGWVVLADPEGNEFCLLSRTVQEL